MNLHKKPTDVYKALEEANEKLKMSENRFHTLFGLGNEGIVILSAEGKPAYISPSIKKVMGYSDAELLELSLGSLVHPDDLESILATQANALANPGVPYEYPISRRRHKDGSWRWVEATITNLLHDPSINGIVTHFRDVTQRKLAQDKVLENAHKYRTLIEQSADGIAILNADGNPQYLSPAIEKMLGFTPQEAIDLGMTGLVHPEDLPQVQKQVETVLANPGTAVAITARIRHKDGYWRWLESTLTNMLHDPVICGIVDNFRDITERKEAEDRLRYSNRLYNFISQINQTIVHVQDEQTLFDAACRIAIDYGKFEFAWIGIVDDLDSRKITMKASGGMTAADRAYFENYTYQFDGPIDNVMQGKDYFVVSEIEKRSNVGFNSYAAQRGFKSAIFCAIKKAGKTIGTFIMYSSENNYFNIQEIALLHEASGDISFALDVFEKDARRTAVEKALQHKELRLSQAQSIAHLGSWEMDLSTGASIWSEEALRIYGLPADEREQTYEKWLSFVHPDDLDYVNKVTSESLHQHAHSGFYHRIVRQDGSVRQVFSQAQPEWDASGNPIGMYGIVHDVTDLKTAEAAALKTAEEKIDILESIRDAFFAVDEQWTVTYWNKEAENFTQTAKEQIIGKCLWDVFPDSVGTWAYKRYVKAMTSKRVVHFEDYYEAMERWYESSAYPSENGLSVYFKDITMKKQAETERTKMVEDMIQRNKDLEQFSYIVSHNLRAPVANIKGLAEELNDGVHPAEVKTMLKRELKSSIKRLDEVIIDLNGILQMKKEIVENKEQVDLAELVESIRMGIGNLIDKENVRIDTDFSTAPSLTTVKGYLHSIFYNLISNSIKYRNPDSVPHIGIKSRQTAIGVLIEFSDNGVGINLEQKKDQIFRLYKRFHQHVEGKGIGLFMVKTQVEMLGGSIAIESAVNQGTTFRVEFPKAG